MKRLAYVALAALATALPSAAQTHAAVVFRFSFAGPLEAQWAWPPNPHNHGRRDTQWQKVFRGTGCGTSPTSARWTIVQQTEGLPAQSLIIDFVYHTSKNPAKITDANYGGAPAADVQIYLQFTRARVTLQAKPHGNVVGLKIKPATAPIKATLVKKC